MSQKTSKRIPYQLPDGAWAVPLTQGKIAVIDECDLTSVSQRSWCLQQYKNKGRHGGTKVYAKTALGGTQVTLHRFILKPPKELTVDHIDGDSLNNRRSNLRLCSKSQNAANRGKDRVKKATSKYKGVQLQRLTGNWTASISVNGGSRYLGTFAEEVEAAKAYNEAAVTYFGEFACLNPLP